jgi:hypothetical protein
MSIGTGETGIGSAQFGGSGIGGLV